MTKENRKLRDALRTIEARATTALEHQPDDDALCLIHLWKALRDIVDTAADTACEAIWRHDDLPAPSGGAPEARKSRRQKTGPSPANLEGTW